MLKKMLAVSLMLVLILSCLPAHADTLVIQEPGAYSGGALALTANQDSASALVRNYIVSGDTAAIYVLPYLELLMQEPTMAYMGCVSSDAGDYVGVYHWFIPKGVNYRTFSLANNTVTDACLVLYYDRSGSYSSYNVVLYCSPDFSIANKGASLRRTVAASVTASNTQTTASSSSASSLEQAGFSFIPNGSSNSSASSSGGSSGSSSSSWSSSSSSSSSNYWSENRTKRCTRCSGDGKVSCSNCSGMGYKVKYGSTANYSGSSKTSYSTKENCYRCRGSGDVDCSSCGGDGKVEY